MSSQAVMSFKERLAKWQQEGPAPLTPEAQEKKLREARERQKQAVQVARARASRYNMTLRSLALKNVREQAEQKKKELEKIREAQERAKKFTMTNRALSIVAVRNQSNVAQALDANVNPKLAKEFVEAAASFQARAAAEMTNPSVSEKQRLSAAAQALEKIPQSLIEEHVDQEEEEEAVQAKEQQEEEEEEEPEEEASAPAEEEEEEEEEVIVMEELAEALAKGDEDGVNRAILKSFLEEHCPERVDEVDELLKEYEGKHVDVLFEELIKQYPDPAEAIVKGESKAIERTMTELEKEYEKEEEDEPAEDKSKTEEDDEEEEEQEELSAIEQEKLAEKREQEKIDAMTEDERMAYLQEKEQQRLHNEKKDQMLKDQLNIYAKGGIKKENPVLAGMRSKRAVSKRVSKNIERSKSKSKSTGSTGAESAVSGDGFILSANVKNTASGSKWAVNVQPNLLRERMRKAGVAEKDIDELLAEESDML